MAKSGVFSKVLNFIGLEETSIDDDYIDERENLYSEPEPVELPRSQRRSAKVVSMPRPSGENEMIVVQPSALQEALEIIDYIRSRKMVIVNLDRMDQVTSQRVIDYLSGAMYAFNGTISKVSRGIFALAPQGVSLIDAQRDELRSRAAYASGGRRDY